MCGRFTLRTPARELVPLFDLGEVPELPPRYNIAPTQPVAAVRRAGQNGQRELVFLHWGLIPSWAEDVKTGYSMINARAETVASKPSFRRPFKTRRCLILADGFYEWKKTNSKKQPYYIHMKDDQPFAFAGLWERWKGPSQQVESCTIIVTEANELLAPIHDRMPVILAPDDYGLWLDPQFQDQQKLQTLLRPYPAQAMDSYPVPTLVNSPRNDQQQCIQPLQD